MRIINGQLSCSGYYHLKMTAVYKAIISHPTFTEYVVDKLVYYHLRYCPHPTPRVILKLPHHPIRSQDDNQKYFLCFLFF